MKMNYDMLCYGFVIGCFIFIFGYLFYIIIDEKIISKRNNTILKKIIRK